MPLGCFNLHASLLPRWRGAAPINRAIMAGDAESGVMVMRMEEGLDTGPVAHGRARRDRPRHDRRRAARALAPLGADLMVRALGALERGALTLTPQPANGRHLRGQDRQERDPHRLGASRGRRCTTTSAACRRFRAPGASCRTARARKVLRTTHGEGSGAPGTVLDDKLTIACGDGAVRILELQRAGKQAMKAEEFLRGSPIAPGAVLR